jgi:hypothetical protein
MSPVVGRNKEPDLGAEGNHDKNEGGSANEENDDEKVGTYQHDRRTFEVALKTRSSSSRNSA